MSNDMKQVRIGNDIKFSIPLRLTGDAAQVIGDIAKWKVYVRESDSAMPNSAGVMVLNGGGGRLPMTELKVVSVSGNEITALWMADMQRKVGVYDLLVFAETASGSRGAVDVLKVVEICRHTPTGLTASGAEIKIEQTVEVKMLAVNFAGMSAYELAVSKGFVGTVEEWLLSLGKPAVDAAARADEATRKSEAQTLLAKGATEAAAGATRDVLYAKEQAEAAAADANNAAASANTAATNANTATESTNAATANANKAASDATGAGIRASAAAKLATDTALEVKDDVAVTKAKADKASTDATAANVNSENAVSTANNANDNALSAVAKAEEAKGIALGRSKGHVFDTKAEMDAALTNPDFIKILAVGDNLYIRAIDVPDYWWDGNAAYPLETQKVDLSEYVKNTDYANGSKGGVVRVNGVGLQMNSGNTIAIAYATENVIKAKTNMYFPIVPGMLDYAIKVGLTTNTQTLTDIEKANAKKWLGFAPITIDEYEALTDKSGINFVIPADYDN